MRHSQPPPLNFQIITLSCELKSGERKQVRIAIQPPLKGYDDVKPRLLEMKAIAQEKLGMVSEEDVASVRKLIAGILRSRPLKLRRSVSPQTHLQ